MANVALQPSSVKLPGNSPPVKKHQSTPESLRESYKKLSTIKNQLCGTNQYYLRDSNGNVALNEDSSPRYQSEYAEQVANLLTSIEQKIDVTNNGSLDLSELGAHKASFENNHSTYSNVTMELLASNIAEAEGAIYAPIIRIGSSNGRAEQHKEKNQLGQKNGFIAGFSEDGAKTQWLRLRDEAVNERKTIISIIHMCDDINANDAKPSDHWCALIFNRKTNRATLFNPMGAGSYIGQMNLLKETVAQEFGNPAIQQNNKNYQPGNGTDCGVLSIGALKPIMGMSPAQNVDDAIQEEWTKATGRNNQLVGDELPVMREKLRTSQQAETKRITNAEANLIEHQSNKLSSAETPDSIISEATAFRLAMNLSRVDNIDQAIQSQKDAFSFWSNQKPTTARGI